MKRLKDYYYNKTKILSKKKVQQPSINNKINVAYPSIIINTINDYCFSNPLTLSGRTADKQAEIKALNDALDDDNYNQKTMHSAFYAGICGLSYKYVRPATDEEAKNNVFFRTFADIDPETTFCVYSNDIEKKKILAVRFYDKPIYDSKFVQIGKERYYDCWTEKWQWKFVERNGDIVSIPFATQLDDGDTVVFEAFPNPSGRIPIIEYERKQDRTGDFELALDLIDAINALASARVDLVEQKSDYIILLRDIDTTSDGALDRVKEAIKMGILSFQSNGEKAAIQPEVKVLDINVNQTELQSLQDFLTKKLEEVTHIPNRDSRAGGSDTGLAVESRNGFRSLESIAGVITSCTIESENEMFDAILSICKNKNACPYKNLSTRDIEIKTNRNDHENVINSTQSYSVLRNSGMCDEEALKITNLVPDPIGVAAKNRLAAEQDMKNRLDEARLMQEIKPVQKQNELDDKSGANIK